MPDKGLYSPILFSSVSFAGAHVWEPYEANSKGVGRHCEASSAQRLVKSMALYMRMPLPRGRRRK